jgi:hypothetical protein
MTEQPASAGLRRLLPAVLRIEARRPASWMTAATAAGILPLIAGNPLMVPAAIAGGGLLAIAAIGDPPTGRAAGPPAVRAACWLARLGWPLGGCLIGGCLGLTTAGRAAAIAAVVVAAAIVATAAIAAEAVRRRRPPSAAATLALALAGAAALAAVTVATVAGPVLQALAALTVAGLLAGSLSGAVVTAEWHAPPPESPAAGREAGPAAAMATTLVAMVVCFFLMPPWWWGYSLVACGWFVCLAVPAATAGTGGPAANRLRRSAAGRPRLPGTFQRAAGGIASQTAILGWPAAVAGLVSLAGGSPILGPLVALASLASLAALLLCAVAAAGILGLETARAGTLTVVAAAAATAVTCLPRLPSLPG